MEIYVLGVLLCCCFLRDVMLCVVVFKIDCC
jgi:hypothetical protein